MSPQAEEELMTVHQFMLIVEGPDLQDEVHIDALFAAGCEDATVGRVGTTQYLDFDRRAETLSVAVSEATEAVETAVPGARVVHVAPDDLVTMSEIAVRTGRTRESVRLLIKGARGPGGFPPPATHFKSRSAMWGWQEVAAWFADVLGDDTFEADAADCEFLTAFNAGLKLRRAEARLGPAERQRVRRIVG